MLKSKWFAFSGVGILVASASAFLMALGPIDPPAGPVIGTSPSLADIELKIDALSLVIETEIVSQGLSTQVLYLESDTPTATEAVQITTGPTRVLGISGFLSHAIVFDGPGSFNGSAAGHATGNVLGRLSRDTTQVIGSGSGQSFVSRTSNGYPINAVAENGLYLAHSIGGYLVVYYEELD